MSNMLFSLSAYLFCIIAIIDPVNNVLGLRIPTFMFFMLCVVKKYKPDLKYFVLIISLILIQFVSVFSGMLHGLQISFPFLLQYLIFFLTLFVLLWCKHIDLKNPLKVSCIIISIITILGYIAMTCYPDIEILLYEFSISHDNLFLMSHRTFIGYDFNSFCFRSLPIVLIYAAICFYKFINENRFKATNFLLSILFFFALLCAGNRSLMLAVFLIILPIMYLKYKRSFFFKMIVGVLMLFFIFITIIILTEKDESSNEVKFLHLESYADYFFNSPILFLFGGGAGSLFYSKGFRSFVPLTEWTYVELIRMYGIIGACFVFRLLLLPLARYKQKVKQIKSWIPVLIGYVAFLIVCGSNPYLINSTGLICLLFIYSYIENPQNRI